jgi:hypothetical protein
MDNVFIEGLQFVASRHDQREFGLGSVRRQNKDARQRLNACSGVGDKSGKPFVHVVLMVAVEESGAGIVGDKIEIMAHVPMPLPPESCADRSLALLSWPLAGPDAA